MNIPNLYVLTFMFRRGAESGLVDPHTVPLLFWCVQLFLSFLSNLCWLVRQVRLVDFPFQLFPQNSPDNFITYLKCIHSMRNMRVRLI